VNEPSTIIAKTKFKLMGDLTEAHSNTVSPIHYLTFWSTQLKPIPIPTDNVIAYSKVPSIVFVNGSITFVDKAHNCFCLTPSQFVSSAMQNDAVPIRALMDRDTPFSPHTLMLPDINCLVSFTGRLLSFESNTEPGAKNSLRAKVSVDTISQLSDCTDSPVSKKAGNNHNLADDDDMIALKNRIRKYVQNPRIKQGEPLPAEKDWPIGSSKAKCKVALSLDHVGGGKFERGEKKCK
jgi:hypothetical protein